MIAESLMDWLDTEAFGTKGTDLFVSHMPDSPDNCIAVFDESAPVLAESQALNYDRYGTKVRVRNSNYGAGRDLLVSVHRRLLGFSGALGLNEIVMVDIVTSPSFIERDGSKRSIWIAHYAFFVMSSGDQFRS